MSLRAKIKNNFRIDKFVNLLSGTINLAFWSSPAIVGTYMYNADPGIGVAIIASGIQAVIIGMQIGIFAEEAGSLNIGYPIKKLFKVIPDKILSNRYRDLIVEHRVGEFTESSLVDIANHYLYAPQLYKIQSFPFFFGLDVKKTNWYEIPNLIEFDNVLNSYKFNENEKQKMFDVMQEHMEHSHLFIAEHKNNDSELFDAYMKRTEFVLQKPYILKEKDYKDIIKYFKKPNENVDIHFFLNHHNVVADWKYLKQVFLNTYLVNDDFYREIINLFDHKSEDKYDSIIREKKLTKKIKENNKQVHSAQNGDEDYKSISNTLLFNYTPIYNEDKWKIIKEHFNYLNQTMYIEDFNKELLESLPILINHDKNLNSLKSEKAKEETKRYISSILDILIEQSNKYIESLELSRTKELKVLQKYSKMK